MRVSKTNIANLTILGAQCTFWVKTPQNDPEESSVVGEMGGKIAK